VAQKIVAESRTQRSTADQAGVFREHGASPLGLPHDAELGTQGGEGVSRQFSVRLLKAR